MHQARVYLNSSLLVKYETPLGICGKGITSLCSSEMYTFLNIDLKRSVHAQPGNFLHAEINKN